MLRTVIASIVAIIIGFSSVIALSTTNATQQQVSVTAAPTTSQVFIDKQDIPLQGYNINGNNYFKLRDLAQSLNGTSKQFSVGWNGKSNTIQLTAGSPYREEKASTSTTARKGKQKANVSKASIIINGQSVTLSAYLINGSTYFKLRDLGEKLNFPVIYRPVDKSIQIMTAAEVRIRSFSNLGLNLRSADYYYGISRSLDSRALFQADKKMYILENVREHDELHISQVSANKNKVIVKTELSEFGGFHAGEDGYYYVIYGQDNIGESATKPVYRIVKYDKNWRKVTTLDIADVYVSRPFTAGNVSMASSNGKLAVHMTRQRYLTPDDGLRHQSNMTLLVDMKSMTLLNKSENFPRNHVSHSFAAYVRFNDDHIVYADHGDAYPRSHILQVENPVRGDVYEYTFAKALGGLTGDNYTGLYLGGFEVGKSNYVVASAFSKQYMTNPNSQNIRIDYVNKDYSFDFSGHELWLTNYESKDNVRINQVHIVKIDDQTFVVLWDELRSNDNPTKLMYAVINDSGVVLQQPKELLGITAPGGMEPLVDGRNVSWYYYDYTDNYRGTPTTNSLELYTLAIPDFGHKAEEKKLSYIEPKQDRSNEIIHALAQLGLTTETYYYDETRNSKSFIVYDSSSSSRGNFEVHSGLWQISTGLAANSSHLFFNDIDHMTKEELDIMKTVLETDLQLQLPDFSDDVLSKIIGQYQALKPMEDILEFELKYDGVTLKGNIYLADTNITGDSLYSLSIDYYVDALKQKYSK